MNEIDRSREFGFSNEVIEATVHLLSQYNTVTENQVGAYLGLVHRLIDAWGSEANKQVISGNKASEAVVLGIKAWNEHVLHSNKLPIDLYEQQPERFEVARDRAKLGIVAWQLTGNEGYLNGALNLLRYATSSENDETSTVAKVEIERTQGRSSISYTKALEVATRNENWERVATIASWEVVDTLRGRQGASFGEGIRSWFDAVNQNKRLITFLPRQLVKAMTEKITPFFWKKTISQENLNQIDKQMPVLLSNSPLQS